MKLKETYTQEVYISSSFVPGSSGIIFANGERDNCIKLQLSFKDFEFNKIQLKPNSMLRTYRYTVRFIGEIVQNGEILLDHLDYYVDVNDGGIALVNRGDKMHDILLKSGPFELTTYVYTRF